MCTPLLVRASLALALVAPQARADGLRFEDGLPVGYEVTFLDLTPAQREKAAAQVRSRGRVEMPLTAEQRATMRAKTGVDGTWVSAGAPESYAGDCTCGSHNIAVLQPGRIAVIDSFFSAVLSWTDEQRLEKAVLDASARYAPPRQAADMVAIQPPDGQDLEFATVAQWLARKDLHVVLRDALKALPFDRAVVAPKLDRRWRPARIRLPMAPRLLQMATDPPVPFHLAELRTAAVAGGSVEWPLGARATVDGASLVLVPALADGESDGVFLAWLVLQYRGDLLASAVFLDHAGIGWASTYDWRPGPSGPEIQAIARIGIHRAAAR